MTESYNRSYIIVNNHGCFTNKNLGCILPKMKFNQRLKWAREQAGLTQKQLVDLLPVKEDGKPMMSQANLAKMEGNENTVGSNYSYFIARACKVSPEWLINEIGQPGDIKSNYESNDPEYKALAVMQQMDLHTKYQAVRLLNSLAEPEESNGNHNKQ